MAAVITWNADAAALALALALALCSGGCATGGPMRSTTIARASAGRALARESRSSGRGGYASAETGASVEIDLERSGGGGADAYRGETSVTTVVGASRAYVAEPAEESLASYSFEGDGDSDDGYGRDEPAPPAPGSTPPPDVTVARLLEDGGGEVYADAGRVAASADDVAAAVAETVTDAIAGTGALLVYRASVWLGVYEVRESQAALALRAEELGGFVQHQTDTELTLRVPAAQFDALLEAATSAGDLLHREVLADDVSEEYRDIEIRLRNLEAMRTRLEALLTQATAVEDALRVERELERVTVELERLRGRQRFLSDRIALATITIHFEARPRDRIDQPEIFALPFYWLQNLGLPNLLSLH